MLQIQRARYRSLVRDLNFLLVFATVLSSATPLHAQAHATFLGTVMADSAGDPLSNAEIVIPSLGIGGRTDSAGRFRIENVKPGEYAVVIRRLGFTPLRTRLTFEANETSAQQFELRAVLPMLAKVNVIAPDTARSLYLDNMTSFEERRTHGFGTFIGSEELQAARERHLSTVLHTIPAIRFYRAGGALVVGSAQSDRRCPSQVYYDGVKVNAPFDIESIQPGSLRGIEYYPASAGAPGAFEASPGYCGVLVIWTLVRK